MVPGDVAQLRFPLTGDGVSQGLVARPHQRRLAGGAVFGKVVSWQAPVAFRLFSAVTAGPVLSAGEPVTTVGGDPGPEFVDGRTVVVRDDAGTVVRISVTNSGNLSWPAGITTPVDLGTSQVRGCISPIAGSDWVSGSLSARMVGSTDVAPGGQGHFDVDLHGASAPLGATTESFELCCRPRSSWTAPRPARPPGVRRPWSSGCATSVRAPDLSVTSSSSARRPARSRRPPGPIPPTTHLPWRLNATRPRCTPSTWASGGAAGPALGRRPFGRHVPAVAAPDRTGQPVRRQHDGHGDGCAVDGDIHSCRPGRRRHAGRHPLRRRGRGRLADTGRRPSGGCSPCVRLVRFVVQGPSLNEQNTLGLVLTSIRRTSRASTRS